MPLPAGPGLTHPGVSQEVVLAVAPLMTIYPVAVVVDPDGGAVAVVLHLTEFILPVVAVAALCIPQVFTHLPSTAADATLEICRARTM